MLVRENSRVYEFRYRREINEPLPAGLSYYRVACTRNRLICSDGYNSHLYSRGKKARRTGFRNTGNTHAYFIPPSSLYHFSGSSMDTPKTHPPHPTHPPMHPPRNPQVTGNALRPTQLSRELFKCRFGRRFEVRTHPRLLLFLGVKLLEHLNTGTLGKESGLPACRRPPRPVYEVLHTVHCL